MKKILVRLTMGVIFAFLIVCHAGAEGPQGPGPGHPGAGIKMDHPFRLGLPGLNIDRNRMDAIHEIETRTAKEGIRNRAEYEVASIELRELLRKDPVDLGMVEAKLKQIAALETQMHLARIKAVEEIKGKLTSEERKKLREFFDAAHMSPLSDRDGMTGPAPCEQLSPPGKPADEKRTPRAKERVR